MVYVVQQQHEVKKSTHATRTLVSVRYLLVPDSLPTFFALLEALSSLVDMIQGHYSYDSVWWSWLCLLRRVYLVAPHDEFSSSSVYASHIYTYEHHIINLLRSRPLRRTCSAYRLISQPFSARNCPRENYVLMKRTLPKFFAFFASCDVLFSFVFSSQVMRLSLIHI